MEKSYTWVGIITSVCAVSAVAVLIQALQPMPLAWRYDRVLVLQGEIWRLVTGAWVHLSWTHLAINLLGLTLVLILFKKFYRPTQVVLLLIGISTTSHLLLLTYPPLIWGVGLSGALHGLFIYYTLVNIYPISRSFAAILLCGLGLKLLIEAGLKHSAYLWLTDSIVALPLHWAGTAAGLATAVLVLSAKRWMTASKPQSCQ